MRRREIEVWPAVADLMTSIAVIGLMFAAVMSRHMAELRDEVAPMLQENARLLAEVEQLRRENGKLESQVEALSNLQAAVRVAEQAMTEVAAAIDAPLGDDLSVQFGEDLVLFDQNQIEPHLNEAGRAKLAGFCRALGAALQRVDDTTKRRRSELTVLHVEGHTDSTTCSDDPGCNWRFAAGRAARFRQLLQSEACPGSGDWQIYPTGLADTRPSAENTPQKNRRIALRLVPDYAAFVGSRAAGAPP